MVAKQAEWTMPTAKQAQAELDALMERVMVGEQVDPTDLAGAKAMLELSGRKSEFEAKAKAKAKREADEAAAAEGEAWFATAAAPLAERLLETMEAAAEAQRLLVEAVTEYSRGADRAARQIDRARLGPPGWPQGRNLLERILDEVKATATGRPRPSAAPGTPLAEQFCRSLGRPTEAMVAADAAKAQQRAEAARKSAEVRRRNEQHRARSILDQVAAGVSHHPQDIGWAKQTLAAPPRPEQEASANGS